LRHSPQEVLARWYHEGLNAFESSLKGGHELMQQFWRAVHDLALEFPMPIAPPPIRNWRSS
jgi:ATP-dependent helicase HepA